MPSPKDGKAGSVVAPTDPKEAKEADKADPGEVDKVKAEDRKTQTGKYGSVKTKPYKKDPEKKSWIEIELLDHKNNPVAGEPYLVLLPDGTTTQGTLDGKGFQRIEGIDPVEQGESLSSIAHDYGFVRWQTIYEYADNGSFRKANPNPNVIQPGDQIVIPEKELRRESCSTESHHKFKLHSQTTLLRLILEDEKGQPFQNKKYRLELEDGTIIENTTNGQGLVEHEVPPEIDEAWLTLFDCGGGFTWHLKVGHLDPYHTVSGAQARLINLGYKPCYVTGTMDLATKQALMRFQTDNSLRQTGELDDETLNKLSGVHDRQ